MLGGINSVLEKSNRFFLSDDLGYSFLLEYSASAAIANHIHNLFVLCNLSQHR